MGEPAHDRRRVLWLIKGLGPGGAEQLLVSSGRVVDQDHFQYAVAYLRPDKQHFVRPLAENSIPARLLTAGAGGGFIWPLRLRHLMLQADVVHAHSPLPAAVARLISRTIQPVRRPILVTTEHNEWSSFVWPTRFLNAVTSCLDDHRFAVSERVQRSMSVQAQSETEVLVHGIVLSRGEGIDRKPNRREVRSQFGFADDDVVAITVANYRKEKDYPNLLKAQRIAIDNNPRLHFLVVGQGPLQAEVESLHHDLDLEGRVHLLGYRDDVPELLASADLFALGSAHEGLPVAIMESFAAGLPVVATDVGGVAEAVPSGACGLIVPPHSPEELAHAILTLAGDPGLRSAMGSAAEKRAELFDISTAVTRQEEVYTSLTQQVGAGR